MSEDLIIKDLENCFNIVNSNLLDAVAKYNPVVERKLQLAVSQLSNAHSIEEFQQIGILVRDSWIEFAQSIYREDFLLSGESKPSPSDVNRLLDYTLRNVCGSSGYLLKMSRVANDLALKLQHDRSATKQMAIQCLTATSLCMVLILDSMTRSEMIVKRLYYKCPECGSIELETSEEWVPDFEGAFKVGKLVCNYCGWCYVDYAGEMKA